MSLGRHTGPRWLFPAPGLGRVVAPALRQGTEPSPAIEVRFDVTVDPRTFAFVRGSITATTPEGQESLLPLRNLGIPIDITDWQHDRRTLWCGVADAAGGSLEGPVR